MLNLSCADYTFPLLTAKDACALIRLLGFSAVDLGIFARSNHFKPEEMTADARGFASKVAQQLESHGLTAADVFVQFGAEPFQLSVNDPDPSIRQVNRNLFKHALEFTSVLGCPHITGLPGVLHMSQRTELSFEIAARETAWRVCVSKAAGITYAIEPHIGSLCADPASTKQFLDHVEGLSLTLDYGHFIAAGHTNEAVHTLLPFASHMHVRGGSNGKLQAAVAENTIDFATVLRLLNERKYKGSLCLEYVWVEWQGCHRTDNVSETLLLKQLLLNALHLSGGDRSRVGQ